MEGIVKELQQRAGFLNECLSQQEIEKTARLMREAARIIVTYRIVEAGPFKYPNKG